MLFNKPNLRHFPQEYSSFREKRVLFNTPETANESGRENKLEKYEDIVSYANQVFQKTDKLNTTNPQGEQVQELPATSDFSNIQLDNLTARYEHVSLLDHDESFVNRFKREITEAEARGEEQEEIKNIKRQYGLSIDEAQVAENMRGQSENDKVNTLKQHLQESYTKEHQTFCKNIQTFCFQKKLLVTNKQDRVLEKYPQLGNTEIYQNFSTRVSDLNDLEQEIQLHAEAYEFDTLNTFVNTGGSRNIERFQERLHHYVKQQNHGIRERNQSHSNDSLPILTHEDVDPAMRWQLWQSTMDQFLKEEGIILQRKLQDYEQRCKNLYVGLTSFEQMMEAQENNMSISELLDKYIPLEFAKLYYPDENRTLREYLEEKLHTIEDPLERAAYVQSLINTPDPLQDVQETFGVERPSVEQILQAQKEFDDNGDESAGNSELAEFITSQLSGLKGTFKDRKKEYRNNKILTEEEKNILLNRIQWLSDQRDNIEINYSPESSNADCKEYQKILQTLRKELENVEKAVKRIQMDDIDENQSGVQWLFVSPAAIWLAIKGHIEVWVEEAEHDDKTNAALIEQQTGAALSGIPGIPGKRFSLVSQKAQIKKENLDAEERGEFKYDDYDESTLLNEFYDWGDGNEQHLRALLEEMAKRGLIHWGDERLWEHMYTLTNYKIPEDAKTNMALRDDILAALFTQGFGDSQWFYNTKNANAQGISSKIDEKRDEANQLGTRKEEGKKLSQILELYIETVNKDDKDKKEDERTFNKFGQLQNYRSYQYADSEINSALYMSTINKNLEEAGSSPEEKMFFIVRGIVTGVIPYEFLAYIESKGYFNSWPSMNWFRFANMDDLKKLDAEYTGANIGYTDTHPENFYQADCERIMRANRKWFQINGGVIDRTGRVIEKWREVDKDDHQDALAYVSSGEMETLMGKYSGQDVMQAPHAMNGMTSYSSTLAAFPIDEDEDKRKQRTKLTQDMLGAFMYFDASLRKRVTNTGIKLADSKYNESGGMVVPNISTREFAQINKNFITIYLEALCKEEKGAKLIRDITKVKKPTEELVPTITNILFNDDYADEKLAIEADGKNWDEEKMQKRKEALKKEQGEFIAKFSQSYFQKISKPQENSAKFAYLIDKWNKHGAFATYIKGHNAKELGTTDTKMKTENRKKLEFDSTDFALYNNNMNEWLNQK